MNISLCPSGVSSFESESQSVSLFLREIGTNFTLNRVESTCLSLQRRVVRHIMALCKYESSAVDGVRQDDSTSLDVASLYFHVATNRL